MNLVQNTPRQVPEPYKLGFSGVNHIFLSREENCLIHKNKKYVDSCFFLHGICPFYGLKVKKGKGKTTTWIFNPAPLHPACLIET
jgi:hypothetical protein